MKRRRQQHAGITKLAWDYLNDQAKDDHPENFEYSFLESKDLDLETGYRTQDIWEQFSGEILADWVRRHPGTRPLCWWRFDSGIKRRVGQMKLTPNITAKNVRHSWRASVPKNQRAWLKKRKLLEEDE